MSLRIVAGGKPGTCSIFDNQIGLAVLYGPIVEARSACQWPLREGPTPTTWLVAVGDVAGELG